MPYFAPFNYVLYPDFQDPNKFQILKNITTRVVRKMSLIDDQSLYYPYTMKDGETPESISYSLYGSADYCWTIFIINTLFDRFYDFPLANDQFNSYIIEKYGSIAAAQTPYKYYITDPYAGQLEVNLQTYTNSSLPKTIQTAYDWELTQNEAKRTFKVINKQYLQNFVKLFSTLANA